MSEQFNVVKELSETEFQIFIAKNLQEFIAKVVDHLDIDAITVTSAINHISKIYLKDMKKQYKKMCKDRAKFEEDIKADLETLIEEVESAEIVEG